MKIMITWVYNEIPNHVKKCIESICHYFDEVYFLTDQYYVKHPNIKYIYLKDVFTDEDKNLMEYMINKNVHVSTRCDFIRTAAITHLNLKNIFVCDSDILFYNSPKELENYLNLDCVTVLTGHKNGTCEIGTFTIGNNNDPVKAVYENMKKYIYEKLNSNRKVLIHDLQNMFGTTLTEYQASGQVDIFYYEALRPLSYHQFVRIFNNSKLNSTDFKRLDNAFGVHLYKPINIDRNIADSTLYKIVQEVLTYKNINLVDLEMGHA